MQLTMLGTGHAVVIKYYNTCFVLHEDEKYFLIDGGGGGALLNQLEAANIPWQDIHDIFVTHVHTDHILGIIWMMRLSLARLAAGKLDAGITIYGNEIVIDALQQFARIIFTDRENEFVNNGLNLVVVHDGDQRTIIGHTVLFFDIHASKVLQMGFVFHYGTEHTFTCCGDETFNEMCAPVVQGSTWLTHEAFCLYSQADIFKPYEKGHSTAKDAAEIAEKLGVQNLILYHTEDKTVGTRKQLYTAEAKQYFSGGVFVPEDLETITL